MRCAEMSGDRSSQALCRPTARIPFASWFLSSAPRCASLPRGGTRQRARCSVDQTLPDDADLALGRVGGAARPAPRCRALASRTPSLRPRARRRRRLPRPTPPPPRARAPRFWRRRRGRADRRPEPPRRPRSHRPPLRRPPPVARLPRRVPGGRFPHPGGVRRHRRRRLLPRHVAIPVVYAGWTNDVGDIITTAARGPALWAAAASMLSAASADGPGHAAIASGVAPSPPSSPSPPRGLARG